MKKKRFIQSIIINLICVLTFNTLFLVQSNVDDVWQWYYINGAFSGKSTYYLMFGNEALGHALQFLADTFPHVQWYNVYQYMISFIALTLLVYILLQYENRTVKYFLIGCSLLFAGYELYVAMVFTKTAGIVGAIAVFALFSDQLTWKGKAAAALEFACSVMLRYNFGLMLVMIFAAFSLAGCAWKGLSKTETGKVLVKRTGKVLLLILVAAATYGITYYGPWNSHGPEWNSFKQRQRFRSAVWDYGYIYKDYEAHEEEYQALGITKDEAYLWYTGNMDMFFPKDEDMFAAIEISKGEAQGLLKTWLDPTTIRDYVRHVPLKLLTIDCIYLYLISILILILAAREKGCVCYAGICSAAVLLALYYYLYVNRRYLQHRVDVGLCYACYLGFLHICGDIRCRKEITQAELLLPVSLLLLVVPFNYKNREYWNDDGSNRKNMTCENRDFYDVATKDLTHAYLQLVEYHIGGREYYDMYVTTNAFENVGKGYYSNIFLSIQTPYQREHLKDYGVEDFFYDIVDNDATYLLIPDSDKLYDLAVKYISDRRGEEIRLELVKHFKNKNMYRAVSGGYDPIAGFDPVQADASRIEGTCQVTLKNDSLNVSGDAVIADTDAFAQNAYLYVEDAQTENTQTYYLLEEMSGNDGQIRISLSAILQIPEFLDAKDTIYLVLENNGTIQCQKVEWNEYE